MIKQNKQIHRYVDTDSQIRRHSLLGDWVKKVKGLRDTDWQLQNGNEDL